MSLAEMQRLLARALQLPDPLVGDPETARAAEGIAAGNDRLSPVEQVDIYREQFWLRHVDCLHDDFASIEHALGDDDAWRTLTRRYLADCPSRAWSLRDLGERMIAFLETTAPWSDDPFLADLARVEWAFVEAFDGPDAPPFDPASLAEASEDAWLTARVHLHPALQRLRLRYPAHDYRIAVRKDEPSARPEARACHVVIYRGRELLHCLEIDAGAAALLDELARLVPLGEACERAAVASGAPLEEFQAKLSAWFAEWMSTGWLRSVTFT
jgi:hypothetical protein